MSKMTSILLFMSLMVCVRQTVAEEATIMTSASVSGYDISLNECPDPNVFIGDGFKSYIETTNDDITGDSSKEI